MSQIALFYMSFPIKYSLRLTRPYIFDYQVKSLFSRLRADFYLLGDMSPSSVRKSRSSEEFKGSETMDILCSHTQSNRHTHVKAS